VAARNSPAAATPGDLVITRVFDAPRELVWKAWTEPERLMRWWGPKGFTLRICKIDLRVGGRYLFCERTQEAQDLWTTGKYREIVEPERIVATYSFASGHGNPVPASHYGIPGEWLAEMLMAVTFEESGGQTKLTLRHQGMPAGQTGESAGTGWNESFDKLAESLTLAGRG